MLRFEEGVYRRICNKKKGLTIDEKLCLKKSKDFTVFFAINLLVMLFIPAFLAQKQQAERTRDHLK